MGDILSTNLSNINDIFSSSDWSPPSAIYSNFNFSTWTIPSFPAVPSGNQVRSEESFDYFYIILWTIVVYYIMLSKILRFVKRFP